MRHWEDPEERREFLKPHGAAERARFEAAKLRPAVRAPRVKDGGTDEVEE